MLLTRAPTLDALIDRFGPRYKWMALFTIAFGSIASVVSSTSFNVAIPTLMREFSLGQDRIQWAITGFMAAMTISMLPTPWLLDRFGFRKCYLGIVALMACASIAGSLATNFSFLVFARIMQGVAAGMLQPMGTLAIMRLFPTESQGKATGILSFSIVLVPAVSPALGGVLLDQFGWEAIFLVTLPICLLAGIAGLFLIPVPTALKSNPFDWFGVCMLGLVSLGSVESVTSLHDRGLQSPWTLFYLGGTVIALLTFAWHAKRAAHPIIRLDLFRNRAFTMGTIVSLAYGFGIFASTYLIPVFVQMVLGFSATASGLVLMPAGLTLVAMLPVAGHMADRLTPRRVTMFGLGLFGFSFVLFAMMGSRIGYVELIGITVIGRFGLAMILPSLTLATLREVEPHQLSQSSMVVSYTRQIGGVFGVAMSAVFLEWRESVYGTTETGISSAYSETFMMLAVAFALALIAASRMKNKS